MVSINSIQSFVKASGVKSILQTKPQSFKGLNPAELKLAGKLEGDIVQLSSKSSVNGYIPKNLLNSSTDDILNEIESSIDYNKILERLDLTEIKLNGKKFYHGSNSPDLIKKDGFKIVQPDRPTQLDGGNGIYLTSKASSASEYGTVLQVAPDIKKVAYIDNYDDFLNLKLSEQDLIQVLFKCYKQKGQAIKEIDKYYNKNGMSLYNEFISRMFKQKGYDALYIAPNASTKNYDQLIVFNPKNIHLSENV